MPPLRTATGRRRTARDRALRIEACETRLALDGAGFEAVTLFSGLAADETGLQSVTLADAAEDVRLIDGKWTFHSAANGIAVLSPSAYFGADNATADYALSLATDSDATGIVIRSADGDSVRWAVSTNGVGFVESVRHDRFDLDGLILRIKSFPIAEPIPRSPIADSGLAEQATDEQLFAQVIPLDVVLEDAAIGRPTAEVVSNLAPAPFVPPAIADASAPAAVARVTPVAAAEDAKLAAPVARDWAVEAALADLLPIELPLDAHSSTDRSAVRTAFAAYSADAGGAPANNRGGERTLETVSEADLAGARRDRGFVRSDEAAPVETPANEASPPRDARVTAAVGADYRAHAVITESASRRHGLVVASLALLAADRVRVRSTLAESTSSGEAVGPSTPSSGSHLSGGWRAIRRVVRPTLRRMW
ncbi:MAG: hypothetical protein AAGJ46_05155 [Planctomycetota bacterium]